MIVLKSCELWSNVSRFNFNIFLIYFNFAILSLRPIFQVFIDTTDPTNKQKDIPKRLGGGTTGLQTSFFVTALVCIIGLMPLSILRKINFLRHFALAALAGWIFLLVTQVYYLAHYGVDPSIENAGTIFVTHHRYLAFGICVFKLFKFLNSKCFNSSK